MRQRIAETNHLFSVLAATLVLLGCVVPAQAQYHHMGGSVGVDLGIYGFENYIFDEDLYYESDRTMSNQWLDLNLIGPLVNHNLATYNARTRIRATQIRSDTDGEKTTETISPQFSNYFGALSFFPNRRYPMRFYTGKNTENQVRYEPGNRNETEIIDPGLAVLRRYKTKTQGTGGEMRYFVNPDMFMDLEVKQTKNVIERQYDFDENRNIWVDYSTVSPGVSPFYNIEVVNTIPDHDVLLYVDYAFVDTVKAGSTLSIVVEEGIRDLDFAPVGLNTYSDRLDVQSDMIWTIYFSDPPGSKDVDQKNDIIGGRMIYGEEKAFSNEFFFEINDGYDAVQDMVNDLKVFNNLATWDISPNTNLVSLTNLANTLTEVGTVSSQKAKNLQQQTTLKWRKPGTLATRFGHIYSNLDSDTGVDKINSQNNIFSADFSAPTHWNRHVIDLLLSANLLSDSKGMENNKLSTEIRNFLEFRTVGLKLRPRHSIKFSNNKQKNPDGASDEIDSRLMLEGEHPNLGVVGALRFKLGWDYKDRGNETANNRSSKLLGQMGLTRKFDTRYMVRMDLSWENENFDLQAKDLDSSAHPDVPQRDDERRTSIRLDGQAAPWEWLDVGASAMWIKTNESNITKYQGTLSLKVPVINLPIRSYALSENRELEGVRPQKLFQVETKIGYNFRKIRLTLAHRYTDETLTTENYKYGEFLVQVVRDFDIF